MTNNGNIHVGKENTAQKDKVLPNVYTDALKKILVEYRKRILTLNERIKENNERFNAEYAKPENNRMLEEKEKIFAECKKEITDLFLNIREMLACANFINVESLTADRILFEGDSIHLTPEEVQGYIERYRNNYSMLRMIQTFINKQPNTKENPNPYAHITFVMPRDILNVYRTFAASALSIAEKIHAEDSILVNDAEIQNFADADFSSSLYALIGSGVHLSDYSSRRVPDTAKHVFDDVTLQENPNRFFT